jgi:organic radical activating enzyme
MNGSLPVVETFHSLQGEGAHAGRSAFFIRLAGCTVGCPWCDTKHSWNSRNHPEIALEQLAEETATAAKDGAAFVVLTGGEPLHHNIDPLCKALRKSTAGNTKKSLPIHLETSGVNPLSGSPNWITLSPKRHAPPHPELLAYCNELKVVVHTEADLEFAEAMASDALKARRKFPHTSRELSAHAASNELLMLIQPGWNNIKAQQLAIEFVQTHQQWRLSLQMHKWLSVR